MPFLPKPFTEQHLVKVAFPFWNVDLSTKKVYFFHQR